MLRYFTVFIVVQLQWFQSFKKNMENIYKYTEKIQKQIEKKDRPYFLNLLFGLRNL